jgi:hypothetical protein
MHQENPGGGHSLEPLASLRNILPFEPAATSERLGWIGWRQLATVRRLPRSFTLPPSLITDSSFLPDRRKSWTCGMTG